MRPNSAGGETQPLGTLRDVEVTLGKFNIASDGAENGRTAGTRIMHGPGLVVEVPTGHDRVIQIIATLTDDDFAFPVLMRLCQRESWSMVDLESGLVFGQG